MVRFLWHKIKPQRKTVFQGGRLQSKRTIRLSSYCKAAIWTGVERGEGVSLVVGTWWVHAEYQGTCQVHAKCQGPWGVHAKYLRTWGVHAKYLHTWGVHAKYLCTWGVHAKYPGTWGVHAKYQEYFCLRETDCRQVA